MIIHNSNLKQNFNNLILPKLEYTSAYRYILHTASFVAYIYIYIQCTIQCVVSRTTTAVGVYTIYCPVSNYIIGELQEVMWLTTCIACKCECAVYMSCDVQCHTGCPNNLGQTPVHIEIQSMHKAEKLESPLLAVHTLHFTTAT